MSTDKSTEFLPRLPQSWNRYAYGRGNPIRLVDPDGADTRDKIEGSINAFVSNLLLGAGRQEPRNDDCQKGQVAGDLAALLSGAAEADQGAGGVVLSAVCALLSIGACAPVAAEGAAVSAGLLVHGAMVTAVAGRDLADGVSQVPGTDSTAGCEKFQPTLEPAPDQFDHVRGSSAVVNRETGEVWFMDRLHRDHYEEYENKRDYERGRRTRSVRSDGRTKEVF